MKKNKISILTEVALFSTLLMLISCKGMINPGPPLIDENEQGSFIAVRDGLKIFVYEYVPISEFKIY